MREKSLCLASKIGNELRNFTILKISNQRSNSAYFQFYVYFYIELKIDRKFIPRACTKRSGFFGCIDKYVSEVSGCYYPGEMEIIRKMHKIVKNMVHLMCANGDNDFALFDANVAGQRCFESSQVEIMTCINKAIYSVTQRILEKWIENEHFQFEVEAEDCQ